MKEWLKNKSIRTKLNLLIVVALLSIVLLGLVSTYLIKSTKVVSIMLIAQRDYMVEYHKSLEYYYQALADSVKRDSLLTLAHNKLKKANQMLTFFSTIEQSLREKTKKEIADSALTIYGDAIIDTLDRDGIDNARLLVNRVKLMRIINKKTIDNSVASAKESLTPAENILTIYQDQKEGKLGYQSLQDSINKYLGQMNRQETAYATEVKNMGAKTTKTLIVSIIILTLVIGFVIIALSRLINRMISVPVGQIRDNLEQMAMGRLDFESAYVSRDEVGQLVDSYRKMQHTLREQSEHARRVSAGDFSHELEPRSEQDTLSLSLNEMTRSLRIADEKNRRENWIKTNQNLLTQEMQGDLDLVSLGHKITAILSHQTGALTAALFVPDRESVFRFISGYAVNTSQIKKRTFTPGEGLTGQAIVNRKPMGVHPVPANYFDVVSGLGKSSPEHLLVLPCIYNQEVEGVIEIGSMKEPDELQLQYLGLISEAIAISLQSSKSRTELQALLDQQRELTEQLQVQQEELRQINEELQVQQEELRQSNEELEAQTRSLEESKASLQAQQEELRVTNEELSERTRAIESQKEILKRKNDELERAREDIEQKARDLEQVSRYKSEFLANMSHELRTPLNSILVLSQILSQNRQENLNEKQIKSALTIHASGVNLLALINEILDLSKIESGRVELHPETISIKPLFEELRETFVSVAEEKGLEIEISADVQMPHHIHADPLRLGQILRNLLSNAVKFTEKGRVSLTFNRPSADLELPPALSQRKDLVCFTIEDTGIGIAANKQKEIFDAFKQADGTTSRKFGGTGLGLAISRNFARLMNGDILLSSEEGKGSRFTLVVPEEFALARTSEISEPEPEKEARVHPKTDNQHPLEEKHIEEEARDTHELIQDDRKHIKKGDDFLLIIEDDAAFAQVLYDLAHEKDFKCMVAPNGETGLHYADYYGPSAIILDIGLPGINGWEVMQRLKENPATRHIPVHFMSASDKSLEAMKKGAIGFLKKPVSVEEINEAFDKIEGLISKPVKKLLVVEDDPAMQHSIKELIGEENIQVTTLGRGKEALELLDNESFDCMILDLGLEDMSGHELLQSIVKKSHIQRMPIIIYTGKELTRDEEQQLQKYSDRIIIKGIKSPERLLAETTLFLHQVEANLPESKQKMLRKIRQKEDFLKDKTVLIVDDDMRNVFALTSLLEDHGVQVLVGKNGREGVDKAKNHPVDLILMDIMMPEMNGYEAMEEIRKEMRLRKLPIIALTAKAMPGDREKCIQAGANDYLSKPIDSDKLISMLRVWLYQA